MDKQDLQNESSPAAPPGPTPPVQVAWAYPPPKRPGLFSRMLRGLVGVVLVVSILLNFELLALVLAGEKFGLSQVELQEGRADQVVAVYQIEGLIDADAAAEFARFYRLVEETEDIKAVVIRVNSSGGGVAASDEIYNHIRSIGRELGKPVVVSMGGTAASGGYYISTPADVIYAEPTTVTGSVGVLAAWPVAKEMLEKLGVDVVTIRSSQAHRWKARENFWEQPGAEVLEAVQDIVDRMHAKFAQIVRTERGKKLKTTRREITVSSPQGQRTVTEIEPLNGKVYLPEQAQALGLIDEIGYFEAAVAKAAQLAELTEPRVVRYVRRRALREMLGFAGRSDAVISKELVDQFLTPRILMVWDGR